MPRRYTYAEQIARGHVRVPMHPRTRPMGSVTRAVLACLRPGESMTIHELVERTGLPMASVAPVASRRLEAITHRQPRRYALPGTAVVAPRPRIVRLLGD